jgi:hypothetical protein
VSIVLVKYDESISAQDGRRYFAQAAGRERDDGLWEGWLEFIPSDENAADLASDRETTQPNRTNVEYWAEGLTRVYLEGALQRALSIAESQPARRESETEPALFDGPSTRQRDSVGAERVVQRHPILDPYSVYMQGEDILRNELSALSRAHVESIVAAYGFSPNESPADLSRTSEQRLIDVIVDGVRSKEATRQP